MILLASTTISVRRAYPVTDQYDDPDSRRTVARSVRAHIGSPRGNTATGAGGTETVATWTLTCDPVDLQAADEVLDESSGIEYVVEWAHRYPWPLPHTTGGLSKVSR